MRVLWIVGSIVVGLIGLWSCAIGSRDRAVPPGVEVRVLASERNYQPGQLTTSAGVVSLTFHNTALQEHHSLVLLSEHAPVDAVVAAGPPDYVVRNHPQLVAYTRMLAPGESYTMITDLAPGTYRYVCAYPGHYEQGMYGILTVGATPKP